MNIINIIEKKKNKLELTKEEIHFFVAGMLNKEIEDYQVSSLLMAIVLNGMSLEETYNLTYEMLNSGEIIDLSDINGVIVDKHSTGGVGDKVTLVLAPLLASMDIKMAKMSGRGLGHTGGTIDKLESIPGYKVELSKEEFIKQVNNIGVSIISQSGNICPADKKLYALRDVTGTVESLPLVASSIMSKKLASGADIIFIDVKVGNGALMKTIEDAKELAKTMINIGKRFDKTVVCILTNMNEPLGCAVGNALEVFETIETLKGYGPTDLTELVINIASLIVSKIKKISIEDAKSLCLKNIQNNNAYNKFIELIKYQHGEIDKLQVSSRVFSVKSQKDGYIANINALGIGELARSIGAGRYTKDDKIDYSVGIKLSVKVGDYVKVGDELVKVYLNDKDVELKKIMNCFSFVHEEVIKEPLIYEIID